jgi:DNA-binding LacI/PurR family transcriptional regulator
MTISVFMAMDSRAYMMTHFFFFLKKAADELGQPLEIVVHFYKSGYLQDYAETIRLTSSAIICNAAENDLQFLEEANFTIPLVVYNRSSTKYHSVNINHRQIGEMAADIFISRGHKHAALLDLDVKFKFMEITTSNFINRAKAGGLNLSHSCHPYDMPGGYQGGMAVANMHSLPDCVFSVNDAMSIGVLKAFSQQGIKVPEQIELISIGTSNPDFLKYASVPISFIYAPVELLARECIILLFSRLDKPKAVEVPVVYVCGESCGAVSLNV